MARQFADAQDRAAEFETLRPTLFSVAYHILGSVTEAEDAVQETWLRYATTDVEPDSPRAYLCTIVTRLSIDVLRSARARRETYVGPWFPEPLPTDAGDSRSWGTAPAVDPVQAAEFADSVSMAALVLLERLSPLERAVFVLHDVFGFEYARIAVIVSRSESACRQLRSRARRHVDAGRPRFEADRRERSELADRFFAALQDGDVEALEVFLAADVATINDGGGIAGGAGGVYGARRAARLLANAVSPLLALDATLRQCELNGQPGAVVRDRDGRVLAAWVLEILDDRIQTIRSVTNPEKLAHLGPVGDLPATARERNRARRSDRRDSD
ncbi:RNA polymerase sigma-70 factor [Amycolatopsis jiangsuensis]|uniref:RNA polymerase sigma-70 factor (ECF subfamily) n=1 Tax=Amycolatopsis jiangsuensis TaxID=1181879 RepID=A0A840IW16_9PSEU|nr:RNA polymerase sigma-70 factor [Amycolatopsis jiangsuensis]MBB4686941.1 RNA polymerase sigma-70 factor (ECF subfamily) [Amycolatopsis jiangsuensis]